MGTIRALHYYIILSLVAIAMPLMHRIESGLTPARANTLQGMGICTIGTGVQTDSASYTKHVEEEVVRAYLKENGPVWYVASGPTAILVVHEGLS